MIVCSRYLGHVFFLPLPPYRPRLLVPPWGVHSLDVLLHLVLSLELTATGVAHEIAVAGVSQHVQSQFVRTRELLVAH